MEKYYSHSAVLVLVMFLLSLCYSEEQQSSQAETMFRIQRLLNFPPFLSGWNNETDFCNLEPGSSLNVVCYEKSITQLHIIGNKDIPPLPQNFSLDSFVTTFVKLPSLKVLTLVSLGLWGPLPGKISRLSSLEILNISSNFINGTIPPELSTLTNLQTLILDDNKFSGQILKGLNSLSVLAVLSMKNNSLSGFLPDSLGGLENLRVLSLSHNHLTGEVPDLTSLKNLQVLDLEDNSLGPQFPQVGSKIVTFVIRKNKFSSKIPDEMNSYYQLERLDLSLNRFVGPFPPSLLSLPSISYLNIEGNRFTGMLLENLPCSNELEYVDLSSNLLNGKLPSCLLSNSSKKIVLYAENCLATEDRSQHPFSFCRNEALAVGIIPNHRRVKQTSKSILAISIIAGIIVAIVSALLIFLFARKLGVKKKVKTPPTRLIAETAFTGYSSKLLTDARYITRAMKLASNCLPAYRTFSLEELKAATNNFHTSAYIGEGSHDQVYRGQQRDGSLIAIKYLKLKKSQSIQSFMQHIELTSKLRHRHFASALGHCFECHFDGSNVSRIFLVFEHVQNGTLRSWISVPEKNARPTLNWSQRIAAMTGVAKGIQFLHTGIVPSVFPNNLKITDVLLDQNFVAKISSYNLPSLAENVEKADVQTSSSGSREMNYARVKHNEKSDIYDFGIILLEVIVGRPIISKSQVEVLKSQLQVSVAADGTAQMRVVDPAVHNEYSSESLKTMIEICRRCLLKDPEERPSIEDVIWNLQFAAQVQDSWRGDSHSSEGSPVSPFQSLRLQHAFQ